jgi:hypothetical protein
MYVIVIKHMCVIKKNSVTELTKPGPRKIARLRYIWKMFQ